MVPQTKCLTTCRHTPRVISREGAVVEAAIKLFDFAHDPKRDARKTEAELTKARDKLFRYYWDER